MELIEVREDAGRPAGAVLRIDGYDYPVTIASPFEADQLQELDWYFEQHLRFPFTDQVRARQAGESITAYGEALFRQLFAGEKAREAYGALKNRAYPAQLAIAVIGSPAFQGLHWEALRDPKLPRPFALDVPIMRRRTASAPVIEAVAGNSPTLNLLVLTARPGEAYDVGYRTITRPLVAALRQAQLRVDVDFVRPGTWQALVERLEAATRDRGAGYYHAIHFDLHGGLLSYEEFVKRQEAPEPADRLTLQGRWGRGEMAPYEGVKAFLSFQPAKDGAARTYHQLGMVAQDQRRFEDAEDAYQKALEILIAFDDRHSAASTYHQLGNVAYVQGRFAEAEDAYKKALEVNVALNDRHGAAAAYHQLGMVAEEQRRFAEAEDVYKKALEIYVAFDDRHNAGIVLGSVARLWVATGAPSIPSALAAILQLEIEQVREMLENVREGPPAPPPPAQS